MPSAVAGGQIWSAEGTHPQPFLALLLRTYDILPTGASTYILIWRCRLCWARSPLGPVAASLEDGYVAKPRHQRQEICPFSPLQASCAVKACVCRILRASLALIYDMRDFGFLDPAEGQGAGNKSHRTLS